MDFGPTIGDNVTLPSRDCMANLVFGEHRLVGRSAGATRTSRINIPLKSNVCLSRLMYALERKKPFSFFRFLNEKKEKRLRKRKKKQAGKKKETHIKGAQSSAHSGQKSEVECKRKSRTDWIPHIKESRDESLG